MTQMTKQRKNLPYDKDKIIFSIPPQEMEKILDLLKRTPDVRVDRVATLKKLVEAKKYHVPSEALAEKMIKESLLELKK